MSYEVALPLFFAVPVPEAVQAMAGLCQDELRQGACPARLPALDGLHVTLAFMGSVHPSMVPALLGLARAAGAAQAGFPMTTAGLGGFPESQRARILWLGFNRQPALEALAGALRKGLTAGQIPFDEKPFLAHLTIARFREPVDLGRVPFANLEAIQFMVRDLGLYQSVRTPDGTRYRLLGSLPLGGS